MEFSASAVKSHFVPKLRQLRVELGHATLTQLVDRPRLHRLTGITVDEMAVIRIAIRILCEPHGCRRCSDIGCIENLLQSRDAGIDLSRHQSLRFRAKAGAR